MKLSEITKKGFLNTLKDPKNARLRELIKEFRQRLNELGWKVTSRYDKHQNTFRVEANYEMYITDLVTGQAMITKGHVYAAVGDFFPPSKYRIDIHQMDMKNIIFWITTEPKT